ncbi:site-specific DNA-methyltransferase [Terrisporobacter glycolicus]|uniref:DNA methylase N-4/N-6 domain-containing protein n=1 Tax=Terrisporobacter glycolicus ATCC 14880 = DSM 1288 TaxID=1121315 RepID=A0ABZ2ETU3_9FIRM|nr:site-specific DNA-methyltransferase [Terrisporobacter glycolicus]
MKALKGISLDLNKYNLDKLREIFPEVFCEEKIDFEKLRLFLGDKVEDKEERYEFTWNGKSNAIRIAQTSSTGTLRPDKESSKNWDDTENLYIEGDNLEVLKLLQKSYFGKVKMIYIDPPYNTGKDFVYKDNFRDNIANYKEITNQSTKANPETNGRYHTDWLNMMYPRLKLARNLLSEDGVIFISIDDKEICNIRKTCDEIFGESNFISQFIWQRAYAPVNMNKFSSPNHDYILCYAKSLDSTNEFGLPRSKDTNDRYKNPDNDIRGPWKSDNFSVGPVVESKVYQIITPGGRRVLPPKGRCWLLSKERFDEFNKDNRIWFGEDGNNVPSLKRFLSEVKNTTTPLTIWPYAEVGHSQDAKRELKDLFDGEAIMDYPKSLKLMNRILELPRFNNGIVLDFFSGSSTTAEAVMKINIEENKNLQFVMVQIPELVDEKSEAYKSGYKNICEIGKERIRRAGEKVISENKDKEGIENLDIGFKVFKLDSSNLKSWDSSMCDVNDLENQLKKMNTNLKEERTSEDLLYEILLKSGIDLTAKIEKIVVGYNNLYNIGCGALLACLDDKITQDVIDEIPKHKALFMETKVIFKEAGFMSDDAKINAIQNLKQFKITDVRSV